ncbi:alkane 1-monooxygenase [Microbulbifer spongiae]|uniref:Alkane 1-monooxygenase n=1 Tax=Microbulbifer spongiae TaxID=2944933 RepID=A0ABY9EDT6_9GAMM|nr:alkane 1-monooxygenase [Microbulbifer sp. MI-G]WKD50635.1 alkane 1-monooxygenase [Microbulbifer sp. MI-G]
MRLHPLRYSFAYILPVLVLLGFWQGGFWLFVPLLYLYGLLPLLELAAPAPTANLAPAQEHTAASNPFFNWMLYLSVPVQYGVLLYFLMLVPSLQAWALAGAIFSMGLMCGSFGINIGHELGHRTSRFEQALAKLLLLSSLNMHFYIEHNRGHHRHVATPQDPASARYGETLYGFWLRSIAQGYVSAWRLEAQRLAKRGRSWWSPSNQMLQFQLIQVALIASMGWLFGAKAAVCFVLAALLGILLLETVNYIEHYGLSRRQTPDGRYERVMPIHSWNSNHILGRLSLFELSRHSDHHFRASRKYPILRHHRGSPQMPTGYPGMMLLACIPALWFRIMHPRLAALGS